MNSSPDLRLLSLDGGGVRGLSELYILRNLLQKIAGPGQPLPKPCDYFDMIGGTSTGGIIAIMLGRLGMSIDECINSYLELSKEVFSKRRSRLPFNYKLELATQFDARRLEEVIKGFPGAEELLASDETATAKCKVFVCALRKSNGRPALLRSWSTLDANDLLQYTTIWQACRATSAAPTFFSPITIGPAKQELVDGGLGYNNPVEILYAEARKVWGPKDAKFQQRIMCLVSIGTGVSKFKTLEPGLRQTLKTLSKIVSDTQAIADRFRRDKDELCLNGQYFRFNVDNGLQGIGLEEYEKQNAIADATSDYMDRPEIQGQLGACANSLRNRYSAREVLASFNPPCTDNQSPLLPVDKAPSPQAPVVSQPASVRATSPSSRYRTGFSLAGVPFADRFVDRPEAMEAINSRLLPSRRDLSVPRRHIYVLHGMGGIGKTQLAANFFTKMGREFTAAFWLRANTERDLRQGLVKSARRVPSGQIPESSRTGLAATPQEEAKIIQDFLNWLSKEENTDWLLVFDNVDLDLDVESDRCAGAFDILEYLPAGHGAALVTSRLSKLAQLGGDDNGEAMLRPANKQLSKAIFLKWFGQGKTESLGDKYEQSINDLVGQDMLDGLPLAIAQAAVYVKRTGISICEYKRRYNEMWPSVMAAAGTTTPVQGYHRSVGTTWFLSLRQAESRSLYAVKLVKMWAFLDHKDFWYGLFDLDLNEDHKDFEGHFYEHERSGGVSSLQRGQKNQRSELSTWMQSFLGNESLFLELMGSLLDFGLVEPTQLQTTESDQDGWAETKGYSMHPVVHSWSMQMQSDTEKTDALRDALQLFALTKSPEFWSGKKRQRWFRHADGLRESILAESHREVARAAGEGAYASAAMIGILCLMDLCAIVGQWSKIPELSDVLESLSCQWLAPAVGSDMPNKYLWHTLVTRGFTLLRLSRNTEAREELRKARDISTRIGGSLRQQVTTLQILSRAERMLDHSGEAERLLLQADKILGSIPEEGRTQDFHADSAWQLFHYGELYLQTKRVDDAERSLKKAKNMALDLDDHVLQGEVLRCLAEVYDQKDDVEVMAICLRERLELELDAVWMHQLTLDHPHPEIETVLCISSQLACSAAALGEVAEAEKMLDLIFDSANMEAKTLAIGNIGYRVWLAGTKRNDPTCLLVTLMERVWDESYRIIRESKHEALDFQWMRAPLVIHEQLMRLYKEAGREEEAAVLGGQLEEIDLVAMYNKYLSSIAHDAAGGEGDDGKGSSAHVSQ